MDCVNVRRIAGRRIVLQRRHAGFDADVLGVIAVGDEDVALRRIYRQAEGSGEVATDPRNHGVVVRRERVAFDHGDGVVAVFGDVHLVGRRHHRNHRRFGHQRDLPDEGVADRVDQGEPRVAEANNVSDVRVGVHCRAEGTLADAGDAGHRFVEGEAGRVAVDQYAKRVHRRRHPRITLIGNDNAVVVRVDGRDLRKDRWEWEGG